MSAKKQGSFTSFYSFCKRVYGKGFNKRAVESLIKSGALDNLGCNRHEMLINLPFIVDELDGSRRRNLEGQIGLFDLINGSSDNDYSIRRSEEFSTSELLEMEKETTGLYISSHPIEQYSELSRRYRCDKIGDIISAENEYDEKYFDSSSVKVLGVVSGITKKQTKNGGSMAFLNIEDVYGSIEVIVFSKLLAKYADIFSVGAVLLIGGRLSVREEETPKIILDFAENAEALKVNSAKKNGLFLRFESENSDIYKKCESILAKYKGTGDVPLYFYFKNSKKYFPRSKIFVNDNLIFELKNLLGEENVILQK